jgi:hypothetical protein
MQQFAEASDDEDSTVESSANQKLSQLHFDPFQDAQGPYEGLSD